MANKTPSDNLTNLSTLLHSKLNGLVESISFAQDELEIIARREKFIQLITLLRDDIETQFHQLIDITAVDYPARADRFDVVYHLLSMTLNHRVRIKLHTDEDTPVPSITSLFSSAMWFERETWDMYGIYFDGNADHRRILTDYGFDGHPLRKDFPLTGFLEVRYDPEQARVIYEPVTLTQDYRNFDAVSPWEGMTNIQLPGDEKAVKPKFGTKDFREGNKA